MYYFIKAEEMNAQKLDDVITIVHAENMGHVVAFGMDQTFVGFANMMVETTPEELPLIIKEIHERNGGHMAAYDELTADEVEELI